MLNKCLVMDLTEIAVVWILFKSRMRQDYNLLFVLHLMFNN